LDYVVMGYPAKGWCFFESISQEEIEACIALGTRRAPFRGHLVSVISFKEHLRLLELEKAHGLSHVEALRQILKERTEPPDTPLVVKV
jgi:hypothetical protein